MKLRRAFLKESRGALLFVFGRRADTEIGSLEYKSLGLTGVHALVGSFQRELYGDRRVSGDLLQDRLGAGDQVSRRDDLVDEANAIGFLGGDRLAGEDELQRAALSDQTRE